MSIWWDTSYLVYFLQVFIAKQIICQKYPGLVYIGYNVTTFQTLVLQVILFVGV